MFLSVLQVLLVVFFLGCIICIVCLSVRVFCTWVSSAKMAEPIKMPFVEADSCGSRNNI